MHRPSSQWTPAKPALSTTAAAAVLFIPLSAKPVILSPSHANGDTRVIGALRKRPGKLICPDQKPAMNVFNDPAGASRPAVDQYRENVFMLSNSHSLSTSTP
jgi:hypothetical protein